MAVEGIPDAAPPKTTRSIMSTTRSSERRFLLEALNETLVSRQSLHYACLVYTACGAIFVFLVARKDFDSAKASFTESI